MVQAEPVLAAGRPSTSTLVELLTTWSIWLAGSMNGSLGWSPACGGALRPEEPCSAAGLPPIRVLVASATVSGAENGSGGAATGEPVGPGTRWTVHLPLMRSPITAAGVPISVPPLVGLVQLDRLAFDLDRAVGGDLHGLGLDVHGGTGLDRHALAGLDGDVLGGVDLHAPVAGDVDDGLAAVERQPQLGVAGEHGDPVVGLVVEEDQGVAPLGDEAAPPHRAAGAVDQLLAQLRLVDPVVEPANHVGAAQVAVLE